MARDLLSREKSSATPPGPPRAMAHPQWLARVIESEIVPRLLMHAVASRDPEAMLRYRWQPTYDDVSEFADLLIAHDIKLALAYVQSWRQQGAALRTIYLGLLAQTPSHLRRLRSDGHLGFARHALARYRLRRVLRTLRSSLQPAPLRVTAS